MDNVEKVARAIMMARPNGDCIVKDWQAEMDNPHVATAYAQAQAALSAIDPVALVQAGIDAAAETAGIHPVVRDAIRALCASDVLRENEVMGYPREIAARQKQKARRIALGAREISLQKTALLRAVVRAALGETK